MAEILALRDRYRKVFDDGIPGRLRARISTGPLHFLDRDSGEWLDVSELVDANGWTRGADVQFAVVNGFATAVRGARSLAFRPSAILLIDRATGQTQQIATASYANASRSGTLWTISGIFPGVNLEVSLSERSMSKRFVLASRPNLPDPASLGMDPATTYVAIAYEVDDQTGVTPIMEENGQPFANGSFTDGAIVYRDGNGDDVLRLRGGKGWSATGYQRPVFYFRRPGIAFGEAFPYRLADVATYPVVIDPTTTIATGTDDGVIYGTSPASLNVNTALNAHNLGRYQSGKDYYLSRYYARFDLSSLDGYSCNSASFYLYLYGQSATTPTVTFKLFTTDWGTLGTGDFGSAGSDIGTNATWPSNENWVDPVSLTAASVEAKFGGVASFELRGDTETGSSEKMVIIRTADYSGGTLAPYLDIDYSTGGGTTHEGSATGASRADATASGEALFAASATGASRVDATASGAALFYGSATGASRVDGTADGSTSTIHEASSTGASRVDSTADGVAVFAGVSTGASRVDSTADGVAVFAGVATGASRADATVAGGALREASATGDSRVDGTAAGVEFLGGSATGASRVDSTADGVALFAGVASGASRVDATASGVALFYASATGASRVDADVDGTLIAETNPREIALAAGRSSFSFSAGATTRSYDAGGTTDNDYDAGG